MSMLELMIARPRPSIRVLEIEEWDGLQSAVYLQYYFFRKSENPCGWR